MMGIAAINFRCPEPELYKFSFLTAHNPELSDDIVLRFENNTFSGVIPQNTSVKNLIATFQFSVQGRDFWNISNLRNTENDFTQILNYQVSNGTDTISYAIDVTRFTGLPVMDIQTTDSLAVDSEILH